MSVVYFPGIAHFFQQTFPVSPSQRKKKKRKDKDIPVSFQMCGYLWEFSEFGQFTSPTTARHKREGWKLYWNLTFLSLVVSEVYTLRVYFLPCLVIAGEVFADFLKWIVLLLDSY